MNDIRRVPYYRRKRLEVGEEYKEDIKNDKVLGLGVPGRGGYLYVLKTGSPEAYAEITIFDGTYTSVPIPLYRGRAFRCSVGSGLILEWIKVKAVGDWIDYVIQAVPGVGG